MSSHLTGAHRRSGGADNNSRERAAGHSRSRGQHINENQVKEAIIDLYLKVKLGSKNEVSVFN